MPQAMAWMLNYTCLMVRGYAYDELHTHKLMIEVCGIGHVLLYTNFNGGLS